MKKSFLTLLAVAALGASAFTFYKPSPVKPAASPATAVAFASQTYNVVTEESKITWIGRKVTGEHNGNIKLASGAMLFDKTQFRGGTFVMDMASITCNDLQGGSNKRLVDHLKSDDFFSTEKNPTAKFTVTNLAARESKGGSANYIVTGDLTIKGITNQISFPAALSVKKGVATAKATLKFDCTKWDIKFRSGNFFENLGDKAIQDDVELQLELVAKVADVANTKKDKGSKDKTAKL
ncbi:MAG: YceI family protein [Rufibacter sp.]